MHLTLEGRGRDTSVWNDLAAHDFCLEAIDIAEMRLIDGPRTATVGNRVYGFAMLAESHVSVHLDRDQALAWVDVFSCNDFDDEAIVELSRDHFLLTEVRFMWMGRGL